MNTESKAGLFPFLLALLVVVSGGCGPAKPKVADAEKAAKVRIAKESEGRINLVGFRPVGEKPIGTVGSSYRCAFDGDLEFTEDCIWLFDSGTETIHVNFRTVSLETSASGHPAGQLMKKGQRWRVRGGIYIELGKEGWQPESITITHNRRVE